MKVYGSNAIRNVAFVGHGASGKTSLVDALAFVSGSSRRHGSIKDGTTLTDYSPDEIDRKHSINLGLGHAEWLDTKINLIDTPGYLDYFGEVVDRPARGRCRRGRAQRHRRGRGGHREGLGSLRSAAPAPHALRLPDGQGARRLRAGLRRREGPSDAQGRAGRDPDRRRPRLPRHHQPVLRPLPLLQEGHQDRRVRGGADPAGVPRRASSSTPSSSPKRSPPPTTTLIERYLGGEEIPRERVHRRGEAGDARRARSSRSSAAAAS